MDKKEIAQVSIQQSKRKYSNLREQLKIIDNKLELLSEQKESIQKKIQKLAYYLNKSQVEEKTSQTPKTDKKVTPSSQFTPPST